MNSREKDFKAFDEVFRCHHFLQFSSGRTGITSFDGRISWLPGVSIGALWNSGHEYARQIQMSRFQLSDPQESKLYVDENGAGRRENTR